MIFLNSNTPVEVIARVYVILDYPSYVRSVLHVGEKYVMHTLLKR